MGGASTPTAHPPSVGLAEMGMNTMPQGGGSVFSGTTLGRQPSPPVGLPPRTKSQLDLVSEEDVPEIQPLVSLPEKRSQATPLETAAQKDGQHHMMSQKYSVPAPSDTHQSAATLQGWNARALPSPMDMGSSGVTVKNTFLDFA